MKLRNKLLYTSGVLFLFAGTSSLLAAEQSATDVLNKTYKYVGSMDKYAFNAVVLDDDVENGVVVRQKYRHDVSVKVDRPGKLRIDVKGSIKDRSSYLNDGVFSMIDHGFKFYGTVKTPKTIDAALDSIFDSYSIKAPLMQLIYSDMHKRFNFSNSKNFGTMTVGGTECNYVAFSDDKAEVHIWIATGEKPLVKAYRIFDKTEKDLPGISTSITWVENPNISDNDFIFTAPKDATKISVLSTNE